MRKAIAAVLTFLMWIMPWASGLYGLRERVAFDKKATGEKIIRYIETNDVVAFELMVNPKLKRSFPDLTDKLIELFDLIGDDHTELIDITTGDYSDSGIYGIELRFAYYKDDILHNLTLDYDVTNAKSRDDIGVARILLGRGRIGEPDRATLFFLKVP